MLLVCSAPNVSLSVIRSGDRSGDSDKTIAQLQRGRVPQWPKAGGDT